MAKQEPIIDKAVNMLRKASLDPGARLRYEAREKALKDIASVRNDGILEGIEKGMEQVALNMLKEGLSYSLIMKMTDLPAERLESLHKKLHENERN